MKTWNRSLLATASPDAICGDCSCDILVRRLTKSQQRGEPTSRRSCWMKRSSPCVRLQMQLALAASAPSTTRFGRRICGRRVNCDPWHAAVPQLTPTATVSNFRTVRPSIGIPCYGSSKNAQFQMLNLYRMASIDELSPLAIRLASLKFPGLSLRTRLFSKFDFPNRGP